MANLKNRRSFWKAITTGFVALALFAGTALADELLGVLTKVDIEGKKVTVVDKDDKEVEVTVTDKTEYVTKKGSSPIDLEKVSKNLERIKEKGAKGITVKVEHEKGVASKITPAAKKKAAAE